MKILMVNKFLYPKGGSEAYMLGLAGQLEKMGHRVDFFGMYDPRNTVGGGEGRLVRNVDFHGTGHSRLFNPFRVVYSAEAKRKMSRALREFRPDVVHLNNYNYQLTPSILYAPELRDTAVIQTVHDPQMACPNHRLYNERTAAICEKCAGGKYAACLKERCFDGSLARGLLGAVEGALYKRLRTYETRIDCFLFPSGFLHDKIGEMGVKLPRCRILSNFAHMGGYPADAVKRGQAVYFGRLSRAKGFHTLLAAADMLPGIRFIVAGDGPLRDEIAGHPNIEYMGFLKKEDLFRLVRGSLVSLFPSEGYENCPLSVMEALAVGTPVIATRLGGTAELIREGEDGVFFRAGDAGALRDRILWFFQNRDKAAEYARHAARNGARFGAEDYAARLIKIYEEEAGRKRSGNYDPGAAGSPPGSMQTAGQSGAGQAAG